MSILDSGINRLREFNARRKKRGIAALLKKTAEFKAKFISEAKKFGIEVGNLNFRSYYDMLGIKYTTDQKAIKDAYVKLVKKYHPDVSSDENATRKTEEINEAYSVLKDGDKKAEYDSKFSKGTNRMSADTTKIIYNTLLGKYNEARNKDFEEFNKRVATPQQIDNLRATIAEVTNWTKRFNYVSNKLFGNFWDYGRELKHLDNASRGMLHGEKDPSNLDLLNENLADLDGLVESFKEADKGIRGVIESVLKDIETEENNLSQKLRRSVS